MVAPTPLALSARPLAIELRVTKTEVGFVELLNWLARHNARLLAERPDLPGVYDSGVVYARETTEVWCDHLSMLEQGHEDCDGLAAARAGELMARGHLAMGPDDGGFALCQQTRPENIDAWVILRTKGERGFPNLYHCLVLYRLWDPDRGRWTWWRDDPSARLGMYPEGRRHPYNQGQAAPLPDGLAVAGVAHRRSPRPRQPRRHRGRHHRRAMAR